MCRRFRYLCGMWECVGRGDCGVLGWVCENVIILFRGFGFFFVFVLFVSCLCFCLIVDMLLWVLMFYFFVFT